MTSNAHLNLVPEIEEPKPQEARSTHVTVRIEEGGEINGALDVAGEFSYGVITFSHRGQPEVLTQEAFTDMIGGIAAYLGTLAGEPRTVEEDLENGSCRLDAAISRYMNDGLSIPVSDLLMRLPFKYLGEFVQMDEVFWQRSLKGKQALEEIRSFFDKRGLRIGMQLATWTRPERRLQRPPLTPRQTRELDSLVSGIALPSSNVCLGVRAKLEELDVRYVGDLVQTTEVELVQLGVPHTAWIYFEYAKHLASYGLDFGMKLDGWVPPNRRPAA